MATANEPAAPDTHYILIDGEGAKDTRSAPSADAAYEMSCPEEALYYKNLIRELLDVAAVTGRCAVVAGPGGRPSAAIPNRAPVELSTVTALQQRLRAHLIAQLDKIPHVDFKTLQLAAARKRLDALVESEVAAAGAAATLASLETYLTQKK